MRPQRAQPDADHPYSLVRRTRRGAVYLSGVLPYRRDGTIAHERSEAIRSAIDTLQRRLRENELDLVDVVKITVYLSDIGWLPELNRAWARTFAEPRPARTAVEVRALPRNAPMEIDAIAEPPAGPN